MSTWWNQFKTKMLSPRQDEYTRLKTSLRDLEHQLEVALNHKIMNHDLLENYKTLFKRIQENRNHLSASDASRLQIKIREFLTRFKIYGFEEIPVNTEQPQNSVSIKQPIVVHSYGSWSKPPGSQKCEDIEMKSPTDQLRYPNEPRRQSKRNNQTPSVHQKLQKQPTPPEISYHQRRQLSKRGGYKSEDVKEEKQKISKDVSLHDVRDIKAQMTRHVQNEEGKSSNLQSTKQQTPPEMLNHEIRPRLPGGYRPEDVKEQKQKIAEDVSLPDVRDIEAQMIRRAQLSNLQSTQQQTPAEMLDHQMFPKLRGGYRPEDVKEQKQKIAKDVNLPHVRDIEAKMIRRAQNEEEKNSNLSTKQHRPAEMLEHQIVPRLPGGYRPEDVEEQKQKIAKDISQHDVRDIEAQIIRRAQNEEAKNSNLQSSKHENRHIDDRMMTRQRMEQENTKALRPCEEHKHVETRNINQITTRLQHKEEQNRSYQSQYEDNRHQGVKNKQKCVQDDFRRLSKQEAANRRCYTDGKSLNIPQDNVETQDNCQAVTASLKLNTQYQQDKDEYKSQYNKEEEKKRCRCSGPREHVDPQNISHGVTTRQKHMQDQKLCRRQDKEEKTFQEENRRSYDGSREYTEHKNIHHGAATRPMDVQYQEEQYRDENPLEETHYTQTEDICHGVTTRQKKIHQQYRNEYKRQNNEEKASEEENISSYNVSKEYTEQQKIHHGVTIRQNQQQQYYDEKLLQEESRRRHSHPESLEAQYYRYIQYQQGENQYNEENQRIHYENYDRMHEPKSWGDSHVTSPHSEEYYIQAAREDGTYARYREVAIQTSQAHQVRGRGRTHNLSTSYQHVEIETAQEVEEPLEILDVHQYFQDDFDLKTLDSSIDTLTQIETIEKWSKTFEDKVNNFSEAKFSLEYFVIDEKLMRMIEHLDKLKCKDDPEGTKRKIQVIQYIKDLQTTLDKRAIDE